jgi:hypothetical protein
MSLLEKATRGTTGNVSHTHTSLFTKALAARPPQPEGDEAADSQAPAGGRKAAAPAMPAFDSSAFPSLRRSLAKLRPEADSILEAWALVSRALPLAAIALFLPKDDFLFLVASNGFPSGSDEGIPVSLARPPRDGSSLLTKEEGALIAPVLGLHHSMGLRSATLLSAVGLEGLWVYHDPALEGSSASTRTELGSILSGAAAKLPPLPIASIGRDGPAILLRTARKYRSASIFAFDASSLAAGKESRYGDVRPNALRSAIAAAASRILAQGGEVLPFGQSSVACLMGSSSGVDPELAMFQFTKTLKRILPFLSSSSFPEGRSLRIEPLSEDAPRAIASFLSE